MAFLGVNGRGQVGLIASDGQLFQHYRAGSGVAAQIHVIADGDQSFEHVPEIAGNGELLDRILDRPVFHPETGCSARLITGHQIDALAHQFGDEQAGAHFLQESGLVERAGIDDEVVDTAGSAG